MKFSPLVERIAGESVDGVAHSLQAREAQLRGEDVIVLSIGDPDLPTPAPVLERAIERLRAGDMRYTPAAGRQAVREAIAASHPRRTGQAGERGERDLSCRERRMRCSPPPCASRARR